MSLKKHRIICSVSRR